MKGYKFHAWWIVIHGGTKSWTIENVRKERELTSGKGLSKRQRKLRRFGFGYLHPLSHINKLQSLLESFKENNKRLNHTVQYSYF